MFSLSYKRADDDVFDNFPKVSDHCPKIFQNCSEGQTNVSEHFPNNFLKARVHMKAVFWLGIMVLMRISRLRFKQSRISMLKTCIYVLGRFVDFLLIFRCIWR